MVLKNIKIKLFIFSFLFLILNSYILNAQQENEYLTGKVVEQDENGNKVPLVGANIVWLNTAIGTISDVDGNFKLKKVDGNKTLVVSFVGFQNDTINPNNKENLLVVLEGSIGLNEVEIVYRQKSTEISFLDPIKTEKIGQKELLKAACCNLSESFETNPSVDVSFTDAVTGTRQIQMLGLAGPYTQITRENIPDVRGLSAVYGLTYIPGAWIENIHLNKGTGSVANGYESIAGQINVDLRNPASMDKAYFNLYANEGGRLEANTNLSFDVGDNLGSALLLHASNNSIKHDRNNDGFLDKPLSKNFIALNRWELYNDKGLHFQLGAKTTLIDKIGGQTGFDIDKDRGSNTIWGMNINVNRHEVWTKLGKVNLNKPWQSVGFQSSAAIHKQESFFGLNEYNASQNSFYSNLIFQSIIGNTNHKFKSGLSFQHDFYDESLNSDLYIREENVGGAFFEYTYSHLDKFNAVAGLRTDYHNEYGIFLTPRLHLRYALTEKTVLRASGGRGFRTANIFAENSGFLASSRQIKINGISSIEGFYSLEPEIAWNFGLNISKKFILDYRNGVISFDFYRTDFMNQVVIDLDGNPNEIAFYNLSGKSFSNSFQAQIDYEIIKRLDVRLAYRWYDVKTSYNGFLLQKPLVASNRAFINLAYETIKYWKFDYTLNWQGKKRVPGTSTTNQPYSAYNYSPDFILMNAQVSKEWREVFELYFGVENLLNFVQENPIISSDLPFDQSFDSSIIWGPIFGRSFYVGLRYKIR
jgi:outer membrane receptor for ferrienterochelin and colicin